MYSVNARVFLVYYNRTQFIKFLAHNRVSNCLFLRFTTCSTLGCKKQPESTLFTPAAVEPYSDSLKVGEELTGTLTKFELLKTINTFYRDPQVRVLAMNNDIDETICLKGFNSFRKFCIDSPTLPPDLHVVVSDIAKGAGNHLDIFPYFLRHIREVFPHLEFMDDLKKIGDIREPANWYPEARKLRRKFIYHCGPTNSGKTHVAIQSFFNAKSGIYCAPLKLLAVEIHQKAKNNEKFCDLITGEEVIFAVPNENCSHISCTIEMCTFEKTFDVAVIDEVQMLRDPQRGWAWTRALLGLRAREIHLCGEEAAIDVVDSILCTTNESVEVKRYERLTKLSLDKPVESLHEVCSGDCVVCFNKNDIYSVAHSLESLGNKVAIIYGSLPPYTKLTQCEKFNNPKDPCKILVSTDAVGMGLNLNIRRIIFYSLVKSFTNEVGEIQKRLITVSQALQIAGRAGRFGSRFSKGYVTTFKKKDFKNLELLLAQKPERILQAGILPTVDQIELFSYYLPKSNLPELIDIFCKLCTLDDSLYFMCDLKDLKFLAQMIDHIPLPLKIKFIFCCAPVNKKQAFVCVMFIKFAKLYSFNQAVTASWICKKLNWPLKKPENLRDLTVLETYHEVLELYLWLSYRFEEYFPDAAIVRKLQLKVDNLIQEGVLNFTRFSSGNFVDENNFCDAGVQQE